MTADDDGGFPLWEAPAAPLQEETPAAIRYGCQSYAVMLVTPEALADFAIGFTLSEGVAAKAADVLFVGARRVESGMVLDLELPPEAQAALPRDGRTLEGRSGCGLCGVRALEDLRLERLPQVETTLVRPAALAAAVAALPEQQTLARVRGGLLHAAARVGDDGALLAVREDVGRHNALDKAIGAATTLSLSRRRGFLLTTSRCGYELVAKSTRAGYGALATLSGPTALAVTLARRCGLCLICRTDGAFRRFA